ncbi:MAG: nucleotidyltransferase family protein [Chitinophagaceae bacterium]|nr:nucleotidyltransferase family protein [Chitinophagaceae bacterium]
MKAMILAAGLGTRFKPWTDKHPKALAPINGKSLLQRNIEYLQAAGIRDVIVNVHHFADQIEDAIDRNNGWGSKVTVSDERGEVLETGGGLMKAAEYLKNDSFVLMNVDILTTLDLRSMIGFHRKLMPLATIATTARETSRYFLFDHLDNLCGWKNVKTGEQKIVRTTADVYPKAFSGVHVIDPRIFSLCSLEGKFSMVDLYLSLAKDEVIKSFDHTDSLLIDVGKPEAVADAENIFR